MKRSLKYGWIVAMLCVGLVVAGCATYYRVTDPQSGKEYYSEKISNLRGGAVQVKDARTGSIVTIQNSEVKEISEKEYKAGIAAPMSKPATAPAAAAPAPAAQTAPAAAAPAAAPEAAPEAESAPAPAANPSVPVSEPAPAPEPGPGGTN